MNWSPSWNHYWVRLEGLERPHADIPTCIQAFSGGEDASCWRRNAGAHNRLMTFRGRLHKLVTSLPEGANEAPHQAPLSRLSVLMLFLTATVSGSGPSCTVYCLGRTTWS